MKITSIKAYISSDDNGDEGVCGFMSNGVFMPMVCADDKRAASMRPIAENIAKRFGKAVVLAKFSVREDVEVIRAKLDS